jgi:hypothetical protein
VALASAVRQCGGDTKWAAANGCRPRIYGNQILPAARESPTHPLSLRERGWVRRWQAKWRFSLTPALSGSTELTEVQRERE